MITEDYVSFEVAKLLKEKGFDEYGMYFYTLKDEGCEGYKSNRTLGEFAHNSSPNLKDRAVSCPTLQMAMKWLRVEHNLCIAPYAAAYRYGFTIDKADTGSNLGNERDFYPNGEFKTYEEAVEAALKYALENLI